MDIPVESHTPSLLERSLLALAYLFTAGIGASVFIWPPFNSVTAAMGVGISFVWAVFIMSSLICVPAVLAGKYKIEFTLIPFFSTALIVAVAFSWFNIGNEPALVPRACTATALILCFAMRYVRLRGTIASDKSTARGVKLWTRK